MSVIKINEDQFIPLFISSS